MSGNIVLPKACGDCTVRSRGLCSSLDHHELAVLNATSRRRHFAAGETVVLEGSRGLVANVLEGTMVERKTMSDGREQIVSLLFPADFIGTPLSGRADATAEAVTDTVLCTFDRDQFERSVSEMPNLEKAVHDHARSELAMAREWMLVLGQKKANERIATFLLRLANRSMNFSCLHYLEDLPSDRTLITIPLARNQIADFLGLTTETVSRKFGELRNTDVIEAIDARHIKINSIRRLRRAAGFIDVTH